MHEPTTLRFLLATALGAALASLSLACATHKPPTSAASSADEEAKKLAEQSREANDALMRGDSDRYGAIVNLADDFTLMSPFGGKPRQGAPNQAAMHEIGKFFKNGSLKQELVHAYASPEMVVLAVIERAHVEVGGLPAQDWALRVTLVYRREGETWRLVHRHADPLANGISVPESAVLARGDHLATTTKAE